MNKGGCKNIHPEDVFLRLKNHHPPFIVHTDFENGLPSRFQIPKSDWKFIDPKDQPRAMYRNTAPGMSIEYNLGLTSNPENAFYDHAKGRQEDAVEWYSREGGHGFKVQG